MQGRICRVEGAQFCRAARIGQLQGWGGALCLRKRLAGAGQQILVAPIRLCLGSLDQFAEIRGILPELRDPLFPLRQIQAERRANEERQLDNAAKILKMHQDANLPYEPAEDGFVFSTAEIERHITREERWEQAVDHELVAQAF